MAFDTPESSRSKRRYSLQPTRQQTDEPQPIFFDDDDEENEPFQDLNDEVDFATGEDIEGALGLAGSLLQQSPSTPRRQTVGKKRPPRSGLAKDAIARDDRTTSTSANRKRSSPGHTEDSHVLERSATRQEASRHASEPSPSSSKKRSRITFADEADTQAVFDNDVEEYYNQSDSNAEPEPLQNGRHHHAQSPSANRQSKTNASRRKGTVQPRRARSNPEQGARRQTANTISSDDSDSDGSNYVPVRRAGSVSNVSLRAVTPFEDAGENKTRSGRLVMKPLNYWAGETVVWKHGEVDGVVRASSVEPQKRVFKRRPPAKKTRKRSSRSHGLGAIDERDEELLPSDWEEEIGVLTGQVAEYDPDIGMGNDEYLETEGMIEVVC